MNVQDRWKRLTQLYALALLVEQKHNTFTRMVRVLTFGAAIGKALWRLMRFARTASPWPLLPRKCVQINADGFGDRQNSYAWSMAWFQDKLYVGTNRNFSCTERATLDFYLPGFYTTTPGPGVVCAPTPQDLDLRAEIWRYTPETQTWERVFQAPEVPISSHPGKYAALDMGFRDMAVFPEPDGTQALYAAGVSTRQFNPGLPPPRILRSTDGIAFAPLPQEPGSVLDDLKTIGFRAMAVYTPPEADRPRLYVIATSSLLGNGALLEATEPAGGMHNFRQVSPSEFSIFELAVFNGFLYVGMTDETHGYAVWKTDATGTPPYKFSPVVTDGAGRGAVMKSVVSMQPFQGKLYVGSNGYFPQMLPPCELIRIDPDDSWEVVVGNARRTPQGVKASISGLPDSFGNPFNAHFWRMQAHEGALYLGTNDSSGWFQVPPRLASRISDEYGSDLWMSENGKEWFQITRDGFGDKCNLGIRTFASTPSGLFVGTANHVSGAEVWLVTAS